MDKLLRTDHRANRILATLEPEEFALLEPNLERVDLLRGQVVYEPGDLVHHVYFPHDAVLSLVNPMEDGSIVEVAVFGREGALGLSSGLVTREAFGRYIVQIPGSASRIPFERINQVQNTRPNLRQLIASYGEALLNQTFQTVSCNAVHSVEARCCRWILSTHDRTGQDPLPLTHEFLAEMLGVERSTVSMVTRSLQTAGLIRQQRGSIAVLDRSGLEETTCECYRKIRRVYERVLPGTYPQVPSA